MLNSRCFFKPFNRRTVAASVGAAFAMALVAGCSSVKLEDEVPVESRKTDGTGGAATAKSGIDGTGTPQSRVQPVDLTKGQGDANANAMAGGRIVYFDFDSYVVKDEYRPIVERQAKALTSDRKRRLQVEGHTDDRGGREYNLALGQKRAEAVAKSLALMGADGTQVEAVSFGKERPAVPGSDESAWAKNRRAELNNR